LSGTRGKENRAKFLRELRGSGVEDIVEMREGVPEGELSSLYDRSLFLVRFCYGEYGLATATVEGIQHTTLLVINDELGQPR